MRALSLICCLAFLLISRTPSAEACYWDKDTYKMEKQRFPNTLELLTGKFLRHSDAFYAWRIEDRKKKLEATPNELALLDDLGVALDKTGQHEEAIETMKRSMALDENRYETHANLGTFYLHSGQFKEGLVHIKRAIEINPDAHFGREIVQQYLVEYVIWRRSQRKGLPLYMGGDDGEDCPPPFRDVADQLNRYERIKEMDPKRPYLCPGFKHFGFTKFVVDKGLDPRDAIKGVQGMMKFSNHTHPILLEVLGDLLMMKRRPHTGAPNADAKRLAARAYLQAANQSVGPLQKRLYRAKAVLALVGHRNMNLKKIERDFKRELQRGDRYFARIQRKEESWIKAGKDPEKEFERTYYKKKRRTR
ncbi:MAG: hypothetical protein CMH54_09665 [Myxococcales bacterium]|nr:hypothetical protein [Myxococcales bacterium]